jgi:UDP-N-acetylglucosamine 4,6-dehydratase/5-epimerase
MEVVMFENKTLMITGGTGSFGKTVLDRFLKSDLKQIIIFSRDEKKQEDLRLKYNSPKLKFIIGDVRDYNSIYAALKNVNFVFHAAALKQVPSCEFYPLEAVKTNILGTDNVLTAAVQRNVSKVIVLSTDKAVYPINAMGISKAMSEKVAIAKARCLSEEDTVICCTRYGNVMGSRGSVIPLFGEQACDGRALTITDPNMTRFLMSLEDSVDLVVHAFKKGKQGDLFVQKAAASTVEDLAKAILELTKSSSEIKIIGSRHGEKLFESLISREEMAKSIESEQYYCIPADKRDLNYSLFEVEGNKKTNELEDYTSHNTHRLKVSDIKAILQKLPEFKAYLR